MTVLFLGTQAWSVVFANLIINILQMILAQYSKSVHSLQVKKIARATARVLCLPAYICSMSKRNWNLGFLIFSDRVQSSTHTISPAPTPFYTFFLPPTLYHGMEPSCSSWPCLTNNDLRYRPPPLDFSDTKLCPPRKPIHKIKRPIWEFASCKIRGLLSLAFRDIPSLISESWPFRRTSAWFSPLNWKSSLDSRSHPC